MASFSLERLAPGADLVGEMVGKTRWRGSGGRDGGFR